MWGFWLYSVKQKRCFISNAKDDACLYLCYISFWSLFLIVCIWQGNKINNWNLGVSEKSPFFYPQKNLQTLFYFMNFWVTNFSQYKLSATPTHKFTYAVQCKLFPTFSNFQHLRRIAMSGWLYAMGGLYGV